MTSCRHVVLLAVCSLVMLLANRRPVAAQQRASVAPSPVALRLEHHVSDERMLLPVDRAAIRAAAPILAMGTVPTRTGDRRWLRYAMRGAIVGALAGAMVVVYNVNDSPHEKAETFFMSVPLMPVGAAAGAAVGALLAAALDAIQ